ncbi:MAG: PcfJ domain-containing protein [Oscillospiraceae bacterium]|nr:PcfJ domain-containing protein [Oscillospiraceae bacterium]MDE7170270.1 PcfJ domain-containing protein [Oscillospiraceae bacterium]
MLDKKALRKFTRDNPAPAIPAGHGLLHAPQVKYIIRTAVRLISHRRTLVLYIYDRRRAASGDYAPVWTMFQAGGDYITLARRADGSTRWREASFERLGEGYRFTVDCAFYSAQDEQRVRDFFHDHDHGGVAALVRAQTAILDKRCKEQQLGRERQIVERMRPLHALPRGLAGWVRRDLMPAYFRCEHTSVKRPVTGICTSCGKRSTLPHAAHNGKITCPHCKRKLTVKSMGKMGRHYDRDTVQVVERISDAKVVVRIVKVYYNYDRDHLMPKTSIYENARIFIRRGPDGEVVTEPYYYSYGKGALTHWVPGNRPVYYKYSYNFEADTCGHVYCRNLPGALAGTPWEYCPVAAFYEHYHEPMQMWPFLAAHLEHPRFEHLVKTGFFLLTSDLAYGRARDGLLDETQNRTHRLLGVAAEDVSFLRKLDVGMETLQAFQGYAGLKDRQRLLRWQLENQVSRDIPQILAHMTPHKFMRYMNGQYTRRGHMQGIVSDYRDYLEMCVKLGYDMGNSFVLYPKDLEQAHDRAVRRLKLKANAQLRRDFKAAMRAISGHLDFEMDGMKLLLPAAPEELAAEGNALHHCVGGYADRVAKKECIILFLRQCSDLAKPFYTVEVRGGNVVQVRGVQNCDATPEVKAFMDRWERQVLRAPAAA